jgi:hypothetical protein
MKKTLLQQQSMVKRKSGNVTALEQITHFATGDVETIYTRTETELRLVVFILLLCKHMNNYD